MRPTSTTSSSRVALGARVALAAALLTASLTLDLAAQSPSAAAPAIPSTMRAHIDPARLRTASDSFVVMLQGKARGWQRLTMGRDGEGWLVGDAISIDSMVTQASVARFGADLEERSLRQEGTMRGREMKIALDWAGGRVRGTSMTPTSGPSGALAIDTTIAAGVVDDNAILPLVPAMRWREGMAIEVPVLSSGKGTIATYALRVAGRDSVSVPAGRFETWRIEMRAERSLTIVHVTRAAPYRVVKISNGPVFEMQLVTK